MKAKRFITMLMAMLMVVGLFAMPASAEDTSIMPRGVVCPVCRAPMQLTVNHVSNWDTDPTPLTCRHGKIGATDTHRTRIHTQTWECDLCDQSQTNTWTEHQYVCRG